MDDEDDKKDGEDVEIPDAALDEALGEDETDDEAEADPLSAIDEFGGGDDFDGKQWE